MSFQFIFFCILFHLQLFGHGFEASTPVTTSTSKKELTPIKFLCEDILDEAQKVCSYNFSKNKCVKHHVTSAATAQINCYYAIKFNGESWDDILCAPEQEFYLSHEKKWIPACQLKINDILFAKDHSFVKISDITLCKELLTIYSITVKKTHNFFVGRHAVITHNFLLPALSVALGPAFGSGAVVGAGAGSCLGPLTVLAGALCGGLIGIIIKAIIKQNKLPHYEISYDLNLFDNHCAEDDEQNANSPDKNEVENIPIFGQLGGSPDPEDPWDRNKRKYKKHELPIENINQNSEAILKNGYYEVNGFKFTEYYYNYLWTHGRQAPSLIAQSILDNATSINSDPRGNIGFYKYIADGWEMIYNPITKIVSHIQPIK